MYIGRSRTGQLTTMQLRCLKSAAIEFTVEYISVPSECSGIKSS